VHVIGRVLVGQVEEDAEGQVQVVGVAQPGLLAQADEAALFGGGLLGPVQRHLGNEKVKIELERAKLW